MCPPQSSAAAEIVVGIDFGTSYSSVAIAHKGRTEIVPIDGDLAMPSVVSFPISGNMILGKEARQAWAASLQRTIPAPKRLLGRLAGEREVERITAGLSFKTFPGTDRYIRFQVDEQIYSATDICAALLQKMRTSVSAYLGVDVTRAVVAAPVSFSTLQRVALEEAANRAGLEVCSVMSEPSASVLAHGFRGGWSGRVAVFDFGGGTFDFSIVDIVPGTVNVICSGGDSWLGGDDFDYSLAGHLADAFWHHVGIDLRTRAVEWQALILASEQVKILLSKRDAADVQLDDLVVTAEGKKGLQCTVSRPAFDKLTFPLVDRACRVAQSVMHQAGVVPAKIDRVLLTGGTALVPAVQTAVTQLFGRKPILRDPHLSVARGTAIQAAETMGELTNKQRTIGREVCGRSIGAQVAGGPVVTIFQRDTPIPASASHRFATSGSDQGNVVITVFEHVGSRVDQSRPLGALHVGGVARGTPSTHQIEVTFHLTASGQLTVSAQVGEKLYRRTLAS
jgi:molecular chaperone DnaK